MCSVIDGYSRYTVAWELFPTMRSADAQIVVQKAREAFPDARPTIISDNGRQFVCREFHQFISLCQFHHITTSPYYPQSNGKIERSFGSLKRECLRPQTPLTVEDARRVIQNYVNEYNHTRLHAAIGYVAPADRLHGLDAIIHQKRDEKLQEARELPWLPQVRNTCVFRIRNVDASRRFFRCGSLAAAATASALRLPLPHKPISCSSFSNRERLLSGFAQHNNLVAKACPVG
ncbi:MAG: hypothetical protein KatS3mg109_1743 [Pirellulaceae bacterium]|nr:MAG: hypothetical protein KatS3mg109_1743 [Pirellulaceae bacterium]